MQYRALGHSGLQVSVAGLGTNNFGRRCNLEETTAVIHKALDLGVTFIDTADIYGDTFSEEFIGKAIAGHRDDVVLATKFERPIGGERPLRGGTSRRYIMKAVQDSLRRLSTDYIDLYQIHFWSDATPIEETLRALEDLVRRGDVRYVGCSNFAAWQVVESIWIGRSEHLNPLISAQHAYNLLDRRIERDILPVSRRYGLGIIPFSPLAGGFLTGKYRRGEVPPPGTRLAGGGAMANRALSETNFATLDTLERFAAARDHTVGELALAWLAAQPGVGSVIAGATRPEQVEENVRALEWQLSAADLAELEAQLKDGADGNGRGS
jgi:aryl-alcohol dehydrogenase-like predicted oxidoreductase